MQIGIFGKTFPGSDPDQVFAAVKAAGFDAVQHNWASSGLASIPEAIPEGSAATAKAAADKHGLAMAAISGTTNLIHPDLQARQTGVERLKGIIREAPALGAPVVTLCTGSRNADDQWAGHPDNQSPSAWRDLFAALEQLLPEAEAAGVKLGVEPELANVINSAKAAKRLIGEVQSDALTIVFDPANLFEVASLDEQQHVIAEGLEILAESIGMAHAKDRTEDGGFTTAGQGVLDYPFFLERLGMVGFSGPLITHGLSAEDAPGVAAFLKEQLA
ncbi:MAG: sugar phosphate isomerase/epimerase family protein [Cohaesibacteraceae bacterium]